MAKPHRRRVSGNPAKQAQKHTTDQARAAVRAGKQFLVRPFPHTEVVVTSTDEDEAVEVIKALQPAPEEFTTEQLAGIFQQVEIVLAIAAGTSEYNQMIGDFLNRVKDTHEFYQDED